MASLAALIGVGLTWAAARLPENQNVVAERINELLPQTQCGQCGYPGCRPYATAVAVGKTDIYQCPPGGPETIKSLEKLLAKTPNIETPDNRPAAAEIVVCIDEQNCIGCSRCIPVCPVDAIVGAPQFTHTVLKNECTGCELCIPVCPTDCIEILPIDIESVGQPS